MACRRLAVRGTATETNDGWDRIRT